MITLQTAIRWPMAALLTSATLVATIPGSAATVPAPRTRAAIDPAVLAQYDSKESGRYLVVMSGRPDLGSAARQPDRAARKEAVVRAAKAHADRSQRDVRDLLEKGRRAGKVFDFRSFWVADVVVVESDRSMLHVLASQPGVAEIVPDGEVTLIDSTRVTPLAASGHEVPPATAWSTELIGAREAWAAGIDGSGIVVANIDTGVDHHHPLLTRSYRGADGDHDYDWWDETADTFEPVDEWGHGTLVMGPMVGGDGAGPGADDIGVAPGATWIAARAFNRDRTSTTSRVLSAFEWITAPTRLDGSDPRPDLAPDVVNISFGFGIGICGDGTSELLDTWRAAGITAVWAAGNAGPSPGTIAHPASLPAAFSAGATDSSDRVAAFSSRGPSCFGEVKPEVTAPGVGIVSTAVGDRLATADGTSVAAPHVAGVAALVLSASGGTATVDEVERVIESTAVDFGQPGPDNDYGAGRVDAARAALGLQRGVPVDGVVVDDSGSPVAGAALRFTGAAGVTAVGSRPDGTFRAMLVPGEYTAEARAFGHGDSTATVVVADAGPNRFEFALTRLPDFVVGGFVRERPDGAAVPSATVTVLGTPRPPVTADADGRFSVTLPPGSYALRVDNGPCYRRTTTHITVGAALTADLPVDLPVDVAVDLGGYRCRYTTYADEPGIERLPLEGDDEFVDVSLPFPFSFYGTTATRASVVTNGFVTFGAPSTSAANDAIPSARLPNGAIYGLWDDLFVVPAEYEPSTGVFVATYGTAPDRRFVIEYRDAAQLVNGDRATFAVVLHETGVAELRWGALDGLNVGTSATVGIEDGTGSAGFAYSLGRGRLRGGTAVQFLRAPVGFVEGTVARRSDAHPVAYTPVRVNGQTMVAREDGTYRVALVGGDHRVVADPRADFRFRSFSPAVADVTVRPGETVRLDLLLDAPQAVFDFAAGVPLTATCDPVSAPVGTVTNAGTRDLGVGNFARLFREISDPLRDAPAELDLTGLQWSTSRRFVTVRVQFAPGAQRDLRALVLLDTDQDADTGRPARRNQLGFDYYVDLSFVPEFGSAALFDAAGNFVEFASSDVDRDGITLSWSPRDIGDDGVFDMAVVAPDLDVSPGETVPQHGHVSVQPSTDTSWVRAEPPSALVAPGASEGASVVVEPRHAPHGNYALHVTPVTNDPFAELVRSTASIRIERHTITPTGNCVPS